MLMSIALQCTQIVSCNASYAVHDSKPPTQHVSGHMHLTYTGTMMTFSMTSVSGHPVSAATIQEMLLLAQP